MTEYVYNDANGTLASVKHGEGRTLFKLITADEFRAMKESFPHHKEMLRSLGSVRYCKAEAYRDHIWGTLRIPNKNEARLPQICLLFYMTEQELIFIEDTGELKPWVKSLLPKLNNASTPELLLLQFMQLAVENDILYLSHIEKELEIMEDRLLTDIPDDFFGTLTRHRRTVIQACADGVKNADVATLNNLIDTILPMIRTNLTKLELVKLMSYAPNFLGVEFDQMTIPVPDSYGGMLGMEGRSLFAVDFETNSQILHDFLYENIKYEG